MRLWLRKVFQCMIDVPSFTMWRQNKRQEKIILAVAMSVHCVSTLMWNNFRVAPTSHAGLSFRSHNASAAMEDDPRPVCEWFVHEVTKVILAFVRFPQRRICPKLCSCRSCVWVVHSMLRVRTVSTRVVLLPRWSRTQHLVIFSHKRRSRLQSSCFPRFCFVQSRNTVDLFSFRIGLAIFWNCETDYRVEWRLHITWWSRVVPVAVVTL